MIVARSLRPAYNRAMNPGRSAVRAAIADVDRRFPFQGYFAASPQSYADVAEVVCRFVPVGGRILDFGAGPLDKTAVLQELGYHCFAVDDLSDPWHLLADNRERILRFGAAEGIEYSLADESLPDGPFDMVMAHDILEHFHDSPRELLTGLLERTNPGGHLFVTVPNAANLRKRIALARGQTNLPPFAHYFWETPWRGHVREYVLDDLRQLAHFMGLDVVELRGAHHLAHRLPTVLRSVYLLAAKASGLRDSLVLVARKPPAWTAPSFANPGTWQEIRRGASPYFAAREMGENA
jgi:SAM-dependent methyltransferase